MFLLSYAVECARLHTGASAWVGVSFAKLGCRKLGDRLPFLIVSDRGDKQLLGNCLVGILYQCALRSLVLANSRFVRTSIRYLLIEK